MNYQGKVYYPQTHAYNSALLAGWGAGVHLLLHDLDEWLVLPGGGSIQQALAPGGCLADAAQARIDRWVLLTGKKGTLISAHVSTGVTMPHLDQTYLVQLSCCFASLHTM
jgi:hypothetical protein